MPDFNRKSAALPYSSLRVPHLHVESFAAMDDKFPMAYRLIDKQQIWTGGKLSLEVHHLADEEGNKLSKEVVIHPGAAVILPFLPDGNVILIRNRRYAVGQILLELPAGTLNKGETPMNAAGRELLEETGYLANRIKPLGSFFSSPGVMSEKMYAFAAYDLEKKSSALEAGEEIELFPVSLTDAVLMIQDGQIQDGKSIATILMYDRFFREGK
jgi:ADP-ribose pyrophosphatase